MLKKLNNIGDAAIVCDFGDEVNQAVNNEVIKLFHYLTKQASLNILPGILNCTPSYNKLLISFDLKQTNSKQVCDFINSIDLKKLKLDQKKKDWIIPICYAHELDLTNMAKELKLSKEEIINYHLNTIFFIYMIGFVPGHPFMGDLNSKLFLNRLQTPIVKVPEGSVGIVEKFCNIYPYESPGGWNILGRTPLKLFDNKNKTRPCLLSPGDTVKFKSISEEEFNNFKNE